jgi:integration host factor subunit alpha
MTKADIVDEIYDSLGLTKKDIANVVDDVFECIREELLGQNSVKISGFGNFEVKERGRRIGRNPKTGVETVIEPRNVVVFRPSQLFKDEVNAN